MKFGAQLYTLRDFCKTRDGFHDSLKRVAAMGYEGVQVSAVEAFLTEVSPTELKGWLDELGLTCCATHRPWDRLMENLDEEIDIHKTIGCHVVGIGMGPKKCFDGGPSEWRNWLKDVDRVVTKMSENGLVFAYHNHAIEFEKKDGIRAIDILVAEANPDLQFILDTYWVHHAGGCCVDWINQLRGRLDVVHLKDKAVSGWDTRYAPVGEGNLPWHSILPALDDAGTVWGVVEQDDCYGEDPFDCLDRSIKYLNQA
ncbi:MAG: sugar phosphate isomerase/epimerase [Armatimonadetes bacterium]|nr:sugar phosphate isomerase/epimerase [Armatimonadota bacterium]